MLDGFILKKLVSVFVHIVPGTFFLLLLSILCRRWLPKTSTILSVFLCCFLIAGSFPPVSNFVVANLENRFPVVQEVPADTGLILVLGYGHNDAVDRPTNSILTAGALSRITEGVRLWKTKPSSTLAVSGAGTFTNVSHAQVMMNMAIILGVPEDKIVRFDHTRDTVQELDTAARELKNFPQDKARLVVVSSATHLPRADKILQYDDVTYTLAPTDFLASSTPWYLPNSAALYHLDRALHEWVGMLWLEINRIKSKESSPN